MIYPVVFRLECQVSELLSVKNKFLVVYLSSAERHRSWTGDIDPSIGVWDIA